MTTQFSRPRQIGGPAQPSLIDRRANAVTTNSQQSGQRFIGRRPASRTAQFACGIILLLMMAAGAHADRKVHVVIAADKTDGVIGKHAEADAGAIHSLFAVNVRGSELNVIELPTGQLTEGAITGILNSGSINGTPVRSDDAVVFYFSGHGLVTQDRQSYLVTGNKSNFISRDAISQTLKHRGVGLAVVLTDACANFVDVNPEQFRAAYAASDRTSPLFRKLFFQTNGFIDINSCQIDEQAATYPDYTKGSVFTLALKDSMTAYSGLESQSWNSILDDVAARTSEEFRKVFADGISIETVDGGFTNQRSQTVWQRELDVRPWNPGSGSGSIPTPPDPQISTEYEITINARTGMVTSQRIDRTWNPSTGRTEVRRSPPERLGKADFVRATDGTPYWRYQGHYVQAIVESGGGAGNTPGNRNLGVGVKRVPRGLEITRIDTNSPVNRCQGSDGRTYRLEIGDVICRFNGMLVTNQRELSDAVRSASRNSSIEVVDIRTGTSNVMTLTLSGSTQPGGGGAGGSRARFGVAVAERVGSGVVLTSVVSASPATRIRGYDGRRYMLETGDVITHINGQPVNSESDFARAVRNSPRESTIRVINVKNNQSDNFAVTLND